MNKISVLQVEYSSECNMSGICRHCYGATGVLDKKQKLPEHTLDVILKEARYLVNFLTITGGEPAVFSDTVRKIQKESGVPFFLMTNGLEFIEDVTPFSVLFSLDAKDIRPGIDSVHVLKTVSRYGCNLACNTVLSKELDLFDYYEKLKKLDIWLKKRGNYLREWKLGFVIDKGRAHFNSGIFPDMGDLFKELRKFLVTYFKELPFTLAVRGFLYTKFMNGNFINSIKNYRLNFDSNPCLDCYGRGEILTVNAEGCVQMCTVCREVSSPIKDSLIDTVFDLLKKDEFRGKTYRDWVDCLNCRYFQLCGCGCPSLALSYDGCWTGKDIFQCGLMERWEEYILPILPSNIRDSFRSLLK